MTGYNQYLAKITYYENIQLETMIDKIILKFTINFSFVKAR